MNCPSCGSVNEPGQKFCGECGTKLAAVCPSCGTANPPTARFCGECGTQLAGAAPAGPPVARPVAAPATAPTIQHHAVTGGPVAERRLVSILFADLVGFTTLSEGRDHEEVRELLTRYFEATREIIERYGGTVEKFIGDAVMAIWGAPTAYEDDAERAVRAGLDVVAIVKGLAPNLQARAGVVTGEAAVTLGAQGQGMVAGDLVNTASRLQSVAPPGSLLVDETTQRATESAIAYEPAEEKFLKGKTAPVPACRALRVVARRGGVGRADRMEAPFVGRDSELGLLKDIFHATARERRVRLVSITGQGGIGKSRLAWELRKYGDGIVEAIWWHQGRSPAYGEGITFWALGEMVRSRAGLVETDDEATTRAKVAESVARFVPEGPERERTERSILTLLGLGQPEPIGTGELFTAWRTYFEGMAAQGLVIMVFEDLHWADQGQLDFINHILEWSRGVPILIITLARPELLERRPDWGAGRRNFLALDLGPLDHGAMRELLTAFVPGLPESATRSIIERAEGIPLYAVETIRMLVAEGRLRDREGGGFEPAGELGELAIPETLHALIAARLDSLDPAERALAQDAAVLGQSFTPAGLAAVSGLPPQELEARLRVLVRSDLLREELDPRSAERGQYAFVQALIREVAYSTLSMKDRRARHLAAARFFESLGEDELAGALAAHYLAAYRATPAGEEADALGAQARVALRGAAERARALGSTRQAVVFLQDALEVTTDEAEQAAILERLLEVAFDAADYPLGLELVPRLRAIRERQGDRHGLALATAFESELLFQARQRERALEIATKALAEYDDMPDDRGVLRIAAQVASSATFTKQYDFGRAASDRVLAAAERLGDADIATRMLNIKGNIAFYQGRLWESIALLEGARRLAEQHGMAFQVNRANASLANILALDDPRSTAALEREIVEFARREGRREQEIVTLGNAAEDYRRTGDWDWILRELEQAVQDEDRNVVDLFVDAARATLLTWQGQMDDDELATLIATLAALEDLDTASGADDLRGTQAFNRGDFAGAIRSWTSQVDRSDLNAPYGLPKIGLAAVLAGDADAATLALDRLGALGSRGRAVEADKTAIRAGVAALAGDRDAALAGYRTAWTAFRELGLAWDQGLTALSAATRLGLSDAEVLGWLREAREAFAKVRAMPILAMTDRLLGSADAGADSAIAERASAQPAASRAST
ncbi:MAG TPA: adenylate/guanylate cyclase domain-containing protein [Candidatus Limnocylindrales bacterium]